MMLVNKLRVGAFILLAVLTSVLMSSASAQVKVLHSFTGPDGANSYAGVILDPAGNLYGTTIYGGGACNCGVVFKLSPSSAGSWTETILHAFSGADGSQPWGMLVRDASGNLYGTAQYGGAYGLGTVYKIDAAGNMTILYNFTGQADGGNPASQLQLDSSGNLYGTTTDSPSTDPYGGYGKVFKIDSTGQISVLYTFLGSPDGQSPYGQLQWDSQGNLYGVTGNGGNNCGFPVIPGCGTIFKLSPNGDGTWTETILYRFSPGADGAYPQGGLVRDATGNLYGTTYWGGVTGCDLDNGCGVMFELNGCDVESPFYAFAGSPDAANPARSLLLDAGGNFYGTSYHGGPSNDGTVFKVSQSGQESLLYSFSGGADGGNPSSELIQDANGNIYGTTVYGGTNDAGAVFEIRGTGFPFLNFPLMNKAASTARIASVFDHSMFIGQGQTEQFGYCPDDVVTAYTGETGMMSPYGSSPVGIFTCGLPSPHRVELYGWAQQNGLHFTVNGQYVGSGRQAQYLFYDGHPGFDYVTTDQKPDGSLCTKPIYCNSGGQTPVLAAAAGTVVCVNKGTAKTWPCMEGPGEIKINHANGYFTIYLHLSSELVSANATVTQGQQIGVSGETGSEGGPHLHFEVRQRQNSADSVCAPSSCIPVDPYGWIGSGNDPYTRAVNVYLWE